MGFNATFPVTIGNSGTRCMLARQAYYPMWIDKALTLSTNGCIYGASWVTQTIVGINTAEALTLEPTGNFNQVLWGTKAADGLLCPGSTNADNSVLAGNLPYMGVDSKTGNTEWLFVPKGAFILVSLAKATKVVANGTVTIEQWRFPGDTEEFVPPTVATDLFYTFAATDTCCACPVMQSDSNRWIRIKSVIVNSLTDNTAHNLSLFLGVALTGTTLPTFVVSTTNAGSWSVSNTPGTFTYFLPAAVTAEWKNSVLPWAGTRLTALSALFTNTTKVLNKEGTVLWGRMNPATYDTWNAGQSIIDTLHPAEKAYLDLERGTYTYVPPSTDLADFLSYNLEGPSTYLIPVYRLDNSAFVNVAVFSDPDGGTSLAVNLDWHIEFRTSSTLFQIGVSSLTLEALHAAQITLLKSGFFFHNFSHSAVLSAITKTASALYPMLKMAKPLAQAFYRTTKRANVMLNPRPTRTNRPAATSGQASGMVSSGRRQRQPMQKRKKRQQQQSNAGPRRGKNGLRSGLDMYLSSKKR